MLRSKTKDHWTMSLVDIPTAVTDRKSALSAASMANISGTMDGASSDNDTSDNSTTGSSTEDLRKASRKQRMFAKKSIRRHKKREEEHMKNIEKNKISMDDYLNKMSELKMWLWEEKNKCTSGMSSPKMKTYFKMFVKLWNKKKLPQKYYRGSSDCDTPPPTPVSHRVSFVEESESDIRLKNMWKPKPHKSRLSIGDSNPGGSPLFTFGKTPPKTLQSRNKKMIEFEAFKREVNPIERDAPDTEKNSIDKENLESSPSSKISEYQIPKLQQISSFAPVSNIQTRTTPKKSAILCSSGNPGVTPYLITPYSWVSDPPGSGDINLDTYAIPHHPTTASFTSQHPLSKSNNITESSEEGPSVQDVDDNAAEWPSPPPLEELSRLHSTSDNGSYCELTVSHYESIDAPPLPPPPLSSEDEHTPPQVASASKKRSSSSSLPQNELSSVQQPQLSPSRSLASSTLPRRHVPGYLSKSPQKMTPPPPKPPRIQSLPPELRSAEVLDTHLPNFKTGNPQHVLTSSRDKANREIDHYTVSDLPEGGRSAEVNSGILGPYDVPFCIQRSHILPHRMSQVACQQPLPSSPPVKQRKVDNAGLESHYCTVHKVPLPNVTKFSPNASTAHDKLLDRQTMDMQTELTASCGEDQSPLSAIFDIECDEGYNDMKQKRKPVYIPSDDPDPQLQIDSQKYCNTSVEISDGLASPENGTVVEPVQTSCAEEDRAANGHFFDKSVYMIEKTAEDMGQYESHSQNHGYNTTHCISPLKPSSDARALSVALSPATVEKCKKQDTRRVSLSPTVQCRYDKPLVLQTHKLVSSDLQELKQDHQDSNLGTKSSMKCLTNPRVRSCEEILSEESSLRLCADSSGPESSLLKSENGGVGHLMSELVYDKYNGTGQRPPPVAPKPAHRLSKVKSILLDMDSTLGQPNTCQHIMYGSASTVNSKNHGSPSGQSKLSKSPRRAASKEFYLETDIDMVLSVAPSCGADIKADSLETDIW